MDFDKWTMLRDVYGVDGASEGEMLISRLMNVWRYRIIRKYCFGRVVDAACGCGAGTWMVSLNPDVSHVFGLDADEAIIDTARNEFSLDGREPHQNESPLDFRSREFPCDISDLKPDVVISVETLEHVDDWNLWLRSLMASGASRLVLSYPNFKTTHFNEHHLHDLTIADITSAVKGSCWRVVKCIDLMDEVDIVVLEQA